MAQVSLTPNFTGCVKTPTNDYVEESGRGLPHSPTLPRVITLSNFRQVLECGSPLPLFPEPDQPLLMATGLTPTSEHLTKRRRVEFSHRLFSWVLMRAEFNSPQRIVDSFS